MPEFIADTDGTVNGLDWADLSPFVQGYLECVLFTNCCTGISMVEWADPENVEAVEEGCADGSIPTDSGFGDIHPASLAAAIRDCEAFQAEAADLLSQAYGKTSKAFTVGDGSLPDSHRPATDYDEAAAGRDFWYTRCGHGVGFWDRDALSSTGEAWSGGSDSDGETLGEKLSDIARTYGECWASFGESVPGYGESPTGYGWVFIE